MTDRERARSAARRLAMIRHAKEVSGNVSQTCRYYGITRQSYYVWLRRYKEKGLAGLEDRSCRPHRSPRHNRAVELRPSWQVYRVLVLIRPRIAIQP